MPSPVALHHQIVAVSDRDAAVAWFVELLELREPWDNGFFRSVQLDDQLVLNFAAAPPDLTPQHYAFLVTEEHFDRIKARSDADGTHYTADPPGRRPGEVGEANPDGTGRRLYFLGPDRHMLEVITAPLHRRAGAGRTRGPAAAGLVRLSRRRAARPRTGRAARAPPSARRRPGGPAAPRGARRRVARPGPGPTRPR